MTVNDSGVSLLYLDPFKIGGIRKLSAFVSRKAFSGDDRDWHYETPDIEEDWPVAHRFKYFDLTDRMDSVKEHPLDEDDCAHEDVMRTAQVALVVALGSLGLLAGRSSELVKFDEPHGIYSVGMSGTPEQVMVRTDTKDGRWLSLFMYEAYPGFFSSSDAQYYKVGHGRMEHTSETAPTTEDIEKALIELSQMGGYLKVKKNVPVPFDGYSVRDLTLVGAASESVVRTYVKVTPEDNFVYMMEIQFVEGDVNQADLDAFLGSFRLGPEAGKTPKIIDEEKIPDWLKKKP